MLGHTCDIFYLFLLIFFFQNHIYTLAYISIISFFGNVFTPCLVYIPAGGLLPLSSFPPPAVASTSFAICCTLLSTLWQIPQRPILELPPLLAYSSWKPAHCWCNCSHFARSSYDYDVSRTTVTNSLIELLKCDSMSHDLYHTYNIPDLLPLIPPHMLA